MRAARAGQFREDLLFRLRVVPLAVPSLRDRGDDILPLLDAFTAWYARSYHVAPAGFTPEARAALRATLTIDGIPGPSTALALKAAGHADGIWARGGQPGA